MLLLLIASGNVAAHAEYEEETGATTRILHIGLLCHTYLYN